MTDTAGYMFGWAALDMIEERLVATHSSHHEAREESLQKEPPAPGVEAGVKECLPLGLRARYENVVDGFSRVSQGQQSRSEDAEVTLELADASCAMPKTSSTICSPPRAPRPMLRMPAT